VSFVDALADYRRGIPYEYGDAYALAWKRLRETAAPEHVHEVQTEFMTDWVTCSCGWTSDRFWDGAGYARSQWLRHVESELVES
jgi:hypothetical protein